MTKLEGIMRGMDTTRNVDLLMVNSPMRDYGINPQDSQTVLPPMGIAYLLSHVADHGFNAGHIDAEALGVPVNKIVDEINHHNPRWAAMNVLTPTREMVHKVAAGLDPEIHLVLGGPHATALPDSTIREISKLHPNTVLITGDAEIALHNLLDDMPLDKIQGAYWVKDDKVLHSDAQTVTLPPDELPIINRKFLANDPFYDSHNDRHESRVMTARGCPFGCTFCAGANKSIQARSPGHIVRELQGLVVDMGVGSIRFIDDLAITSERRVREIFDAYQREGLPAFAWDATGRVNILAKMKPDTIHYFKKLGMEEVAVGIESGSERLRKMVNKNVSKDDIYMSIEKLTGAGIGVKGYFIIGLRGETKKETEETIRMSKDLVLRYPGVFRGSFCQFRPYPGTQEWQALLKEGWTEEQLMEMDTEFGQGNRLAKQIVVPQNQFSETPPYELAQKIKDYYEWQRTITGRY